MARIVLFNNKGVTLIEMMVAIVILLIVSLALMQTSLVGISTNVKNLMRDEAVNIAEMRINQLRNQQFTASTVSSALTATTDAAEAALQRSFRGFSVDFTPSLTIADITGDTKQITVTVSWSYKGKANSQGMTTIMRRQ